MNDKIKGSIMGLVLTVTMLVTLMSAFLVLRSQLDMQVAYLYDENDRLLNNARSGLEWLMSPDNPVPLDGQLVTDLFDNGTDSVELTRKSWGVFEVVTSKAFHGNKSMLKKALIGTRSATDTLAPTLYVSDFEKPISICGQTRLNGKCYVPAAGFKRAYIEGQNYSGDRYVYGTQLNSKRELPALQKDFKKLVELQLAQPFSADDSIVNFSSLEKDSLVRTFDQKTLVLSSASVIYLSGLFLSGNIKVTAPKIVVASSAQLSNLMLFANEIIVEDHNRLQAQLFAQKSVYIGESCTLLYPSVVVVFARNDTSVAQDEPQVTIGEKTTITGDIIVWKEKKYLETEAWLSLDKETTINGNVYVNGRLDVKGNIYGSTYCDRFFLKTNSGIYENHLLNAVLDASKLPPYYTGACIIHAGTKREVLQWL